MSDRIIRVLVLDDDPDDIALIKNFLEKSSRALYSVLPALKTEEAHKQLKTNNIDLLILDHRLSGGSDSTGLDFLREVRKLFPFLPVIFVTGHGDRKIQIEAFDLGASDYLEKGAYNSDMLERCITQAIKSKKTGVHDSAHILQELALFTRQSVETQEKVSKQLEDLKSEVCAVKEEVQHTSKDLNLQIKDLKDHATQQIQTIQEKNWLFLTKDVTNWVSQKPGFFLSLVVVVLGVLVFSLFFLNNLDAIKILQIIQWFK